MTAMASAGSAGSSSSMAAWRRSTASTMASSSSSRDPKWWMSIRWLVPTAAAMSRSERPPIPPEANASIRSSSSSWRRRSSGRRGTTPALLASSPQPLALEVEVTAGEPPHEHADHHADRAALLDALAHQCAALLAHDLVGRDRGAAGRVLAPLPRHARVDGGHLPDELGQARLLDREALPDGQPGTVQGHHPIDRCRPLRPALDVGVDLPDG